MLSYRACMASVLAVNFLSLSVPCAAQDGVGKDSIVIGQSAALTGPGAMIGNGAREGALAYFAEVNRKGGVHGRKIVLESLDDAFNAGKAAANTRSLIAKKNVFALFGYVGGPASIAALAIATEAKMPFVGALNGNDALRDPFNRYAFNVRASFADELVYVIDHLTTVGMSRVAVFHANDAPGRRALATVEQALSKKGLKPIPLPYERNSMVFPQLLPVLAEQDSQAVILVGAPGTAAAFVREAKKVNLNPQFVGLSSIGASELVKELGADAHGVGMMQVVPLPNSATFPIVSEYQKAMAQAGTKNLSHASLEGFIAAKVLVEGLRRAGPRLTRERFIEAMETLTGYDLGGPVVSFSPKNHSSATFVELTVVGKNGAILR